MEVLLDRYEIIDRLGTGGLAEILKVRDRAVPGRVLAVKRLRPNIASTELLAEFQALAQVQHPNLPAVYDYHTDLGNGRPGYTLEAIDGETADRVADTLGTDCLADIAGGLLRALAHIHAHGIVHGDIHPHNLLVNTPDGWTPNGPPLQVTLLDLAPGTPRSGGMGALPFLAPERLEGQPPSVAADLFSVGVTLHRLATGALPYPDYPHLPPGGVPANAEALGPLRPMVEELMAPRPEDRPTRASSVLARLGEALSAPIATLEPEAIRATLLHGPTHPIPTEDGPWPARLADAVDAEILAKGTSGVVIVKGALGSGRSRALRDLRWTLQANANVLTLHTAATAADTPGAAIRRLMTQIPPARRDELPRDWADTIDAMVRQGPPEQQGDHDPEKSRALLVDRLARSLLTLGKRHSLAILVDDLELADALSAEVVASLGRYASYRPTEVDSLALVIAGEPGDALDELVSLCRTVTTFETPALTADTTEALVRTTFLGRTPARELVAALVQQTGGNPLTTCEAIALAFRNGWLALEPERVALDASCPSPLPLPASAADALTARLDALSEALWPLLLLLAEAPMPVPAALVGPALDVDDDDIAPLLERLRGGAIVARELEGDQLRLSLATPTLAKLVKERASTRGLDSAPLFERLAELNLTRADLASQVIGADAARRAEGDLRRAVTIGETLVRRGMAHEALRLLEPVGTAAAGPLGDAYALLGRDDDAIATYQGLAPREAARRRGILLQRRGRFDDAIPLLEDALGSGPERDAETRCWMARAALLQSRYDDALSLCARARIDAPGELIPRLDWIEGLVNFYRGDYDEAGRAFREASNAWAASGHLVEQADVINAIGLIHYRQSELGPALDCFHDALKLAARSGDRDRALLTLMNVAVIHQARGEWGLAESRYHEALKTAHVLGHRSGIMKVTQNLGNLYRYLGELDRAAEHLDDSLRLARAEANDYLVAHNRCLLGEIAWLQGRSDNAITELEAALAAFQKVGSVGETADCARSLATVLVDRGELERAQAQAELALEKAQEVGLPRVEAMATATLAEIAREQGHGGAWATRLESATDSMRKLKRPDELWQLLFERHRLHRALGQSDDARKTGLEALRTLEELAARLPEARRDTFLGIRNRRRAIEELRWLETLSAGSAAPDSQLTRLLDVNQRLAQELELPKLLEYIIDSAILLTGAERGFVLMLDPGKKEPDNLKIVVARNIDQENIRNKRYKVSYSIAQRVIEAGEAVLTTDAMGDDRYNEYLSIHHLKLRSVLCLPMSRAGKVHGALYIDNRFQKSAFTEADLQFMEAFANQAAIALSNAQILDERKRALEDLAQSQQQVEELNAKLREQLAAKERALEETEQMLVVQRKQLESNHSYESIVGNSDALKRVFHVLDRVCESEIPVLVTGESGTGKELVARAIHYNGPRRDRPFVAINCSSIPETLIESELFGHVRGAFTGATADKKGVFEVANRGTLFLDEIGEMPIEMQAKLLRALQEGEIQKVGSPRTVKVDVRIVAATNRKLREMISAKTFREDLYYRLAVVTIKLPSLRERIEDVPLLVSHFLEKNRADGLGSVEAMAPEALRLLMRYRWPGNVRELETVIKNASIFAEDTTLRPRDFSNFPNIIGKQKGSTPPPNTQTVRRLEELERDAIIHALEVNRGNKKRTAEQLGIDRRTLYNKLAAYGISVERRAQVVGRD